MNVVGINIAFITARYLICCTVYMYVIWHVSIHVPTCVIHAVFMKLEPFYFRH